jgi:hypothetical protein
VKKRETVKVQITGRFRNDLQELKLKRRKKVNNREEWVFAVKEPKAFRDSKSQEESNHKRQLRLYFSSILRYNCKFKKIPV